MIGIIEADLLELEAIKKALADKIADTEGHIGMLRPEFAAEAEAFLGALHGTAPVAAAPAEEAPVEEAPAEEPAPKAKAAPKAAKKA